MGTIIPKMQEDASVYSPIFQEASVQKYHIGQQVFIRDRKGRKVLGTILNIVNGWWGQIEYLVEYESPIDDANTITVTQELLDRFNAKKCHEKNPCVKQKDGLTKSERRARIAEIKEAINDYSIILDSELKKAEARETRRTIQRLKEELHCLKRKVKHVSVNRITDTYGMALYAGNNYEWENDPT